MHFLSMSFSSTKLCLYERQPEKAQKSILCAQPRTTFFDLVSSMWQWFPRHSRTAKIVSLNVAQISDLKTYLPYFSIEIWKKRECLKIWVCKPTPAYLELFPRAGDISHISFQFSLNFTAVRMWSVRMGSHVTLCENVCPNDHFL